jgi:hypothetical protein
MAQTLRILETFRHELFTGYTVAVQVSATDDPAPRTKYSMKIGQIRTNNREGDAQFGTEYLAPFLFIRTDSLSVRSQADAVATLVRSAETFIEDRIREERRVFDEEQATRGKPETRRTGKTQKNRDRRAGGRP